MLHIYICDDSVEFRRIFDQTINNLARQIFPKTLEYKIEDSVGSGKELLKRIESKSIDVLFLDIDMPEMSGLELAKKITETNKDTLIIFVSGYNHYVYEVFDFFPFAYMRKDHLIDELPHVLKRIADKFDKQNHMISLSTVKGDIKIDERDIVYISSNSNYYELKTIHGKTLVCRGTLREAESVVNGEEFFRIHSAYIVNMNHIQKVDQNEIFVTNEKTSLPVAQRRLAEFRKAYSEFTLRSFNL